MSHKDKLREQLLVENPQNINLFECRNEMKNEGKSEIEIKAFLQKVMAARKQAEAVTSNPVTVKPTASLTRAVTSPEPAIVAKPEPAIVEPNASRSSGLPRSSTSPIAPKSEPSTLPEPIARSIGLPRALTNPDLQSLKNDPNRIPDKPFNPNLLKQLNDLSIKITETENFGGEITMWEVSSVVQNLQTQDCTDVDVATQIIESWGRKICDVEQVTFLTPYELEELKVDIQDDMCDDELQMDSELIEGTFQLLIESFTEILGSSEGWVIYDVGGVMSTKQKKFQDEEYLLESRFWIFCSSESILALTKVFVNDSIPAEYRDSMMTGKEVVFVTAKSDRWLENTKKIAAAQVEAAKAEAAKRNSAKNKNLRKISKPREEQKEAKVACGHFTPQAFKKTHCATCFCPQEAHRSVPTTNPPEVKVVPKKGPVAVFGAPVEEEKKVACDNFTPQSFKKTHCATCFCPQEVHKSVPTTNPPEVKVVPKKGPDAVFGASVEEEKKVACDNFTPQAFKKTHCSTCFCSRGDHAKKESPTKPEPKVEQKANPEPGKVENKISEVAKQQAAEREAKKKELAARIEAAKKEAAEREQKALKETQNNIKESEREAKMKELAAKIETAKKEAAKNETAKKEVAEKAKRESDLKKETSSKPLVLEDDIEAMPIAEIEAEENAKKETMEKLRAEAIVRAKAEKEDEEMKEREVLELKEREALELAKERTRLENEKKEEELRKKKEIEEERQRQEEEERNRPLTDEEKAEKERKQKIAEIMHETPEIEAAKKRRQEDLHETRAKYSLINSERNEIIQKENDEKAAAERAREEKEQLEISKLPENTPDWKKKQAAEERDKKRKVDQERDAKKYRELEAKRSIGMESEAAEAAMDLEGAKAAHKTEELEECLHLYEMSLAKYPIHGDYAEKRAEVEKEYTEIAVNYKKSKAVQLVSSVEALVAMREYSLAIECYMTAQEYDSSLGKKCQKAMDELEAEKKEYEQEQYRVEQDQLLKQDQERLARELEEEKRKAMERQDQLDAERKRQEEEEERQREQKRLQDIEDRKFEEEERVRKQLEEEEERKAAELRRIEEEKRDEDERLARLQKIEEAKRKAEQEAEAEAARIIAEEQEAERKRVEEENRMLEEMDKKRREEREAKERERVEAQKKAEAEEQAEFEARAARRAKNRELRNAGSTAEAGPEGVTSPRETAAERRAKRERALAEAEEK